MSEQNAATIAGRLLGLIRHGPDRCCRSKQVCDDIKFASDELVRLKAENERLERKVEWFMGREEKILQSLGPLEQSRRDCFNEQVRKLDAAPTPKH